MTRFRRGVDSELVFLQVFDTSAKIRDLNCSHSAPLAIMTQCMHKNSR